MRPLKEILESFGITDEELDYAVQQLSELVERINELDDPRFELFRHRLVLDLEQYRKDKFSRDEFRAHKARSKEKEL